MELLGDVAHVESRFGTFRDRCMVCAKRTIGSKFFLHSPDGTPVL
jgi:hypothetical protein